MNSMIVLVFAELIEEGCFLTVFQVMIQVKRFVFQIVNNFLEFSIFIEL